VRCTHPVAGVDLNLPPTTERLAKGEVEHARRLGHHEGGGRGVIGRAVALGLTAMHPLDQGARARVARRLARTTELWTFRAMRRVAVAVTAIGLVGGGEATFGALLGDGGVLLCELREYGHDNHAAGQCELERGLPDDGL
jgi:hypothetical protein